MASSSSSTTKPAEQLRATPSLGNVMHEWRQWLAPGVVVAIVLAMSALQRAEIRELRMEVRTGAQELRTEFQSGIRDINGKIDRVNGRIDQLYQLLLP